MRYNLALLVLLAACSKSVTSPAPFTDPPAAVHVVNVSGHIFTAWQIVIGPDANHTGLGPAGDSDPDCPPGGGRFCSNPMCLQSAQVNSERRFVEAAVVPGSSLDTLLHSINASGSPERVTAWADSLARGLLTPATLLASHPGLIAATQPFDPAPVGFAFPPDTVPWRWTVGVENATIAVDTSDHACVGRST